MIIDYIINNQLNIDKETYITTVVGQIAIYGILLTFYQFVASFQGNSDSVTKYLGVNLTEYFMKKKVSTFNLIVSKPYFYILFILEALYKPILNIYGNYFPENLIRILNFLWYSFVIFYFVIFIILFWQCTQNILILKRMSDPKRNGTVIRDINKNFMKKSIRERMMIRSIDLLIFDIKCLRQAIIDDNNPRLQSKYNDLIIEIFDSYISNKKKEINIIIEKKKIVKNQVGWVYNTQMECALLKEIFNGNYFIIDEEFKKYICVLHLNLIKLLMIRASVEGREYINQELYPQELFVFGEKNSLLDCKDWKELTINIFKNSDVEIKKRLINSLHKGYCSAEIMFQEYCNQCIFDLIRMNIDEIFSKNKSQNEFAQIFGELIRTKEFNDYYANIIRDELISYNDRDAVEMVKLLNKENCTYVFLYIIICYSIYKFRFDWEYINIAVMKALWDNHGNMNENSEKVIKEFKESNIGHRFSEIMYYKLIEYIQKPLTGSLLNSIYEEDIVNMFYVTIIKLCVLEQSYNDYENKANDYKQIYFINELSNHNELIKYDKVKEMVLNMQYRYFTKLEQIPQKLNISLKNLLLTNISITLEFLSVEPRYAYYNSIGEYALIKLPETKQENIILKELIRKAYIARNISINEYIDFLSKECHLCGCDLNYVHKEKMKEYLLNII
ncbi:hypothetical protein [Massilibacterium senegalense]|uniref:hypothetical protein n=1 Tax=Massilibacterium senegalense TaxID=1632858 RepID=UPI0007851D10|nr:hypothetical protein [Massilibacterium senegalense]